MIFVLLAILKYTGLVILFLFALLLVVACVLLFCPLSYKAAGRGSNVRLVVKWLFSALTFRLEYLENKLKVDFLIFGRKRKPRKLSSTKDAKPKKSKPKDTQTKDTQPKDAQLKDTQSEYAHSEDTEKTPESTSQTSEVKEDTQTEPSATKRKKKQGGKKPKQRKEKFTDDEGRFKRILALAKLFIDYPDRNIIIKKTILLFKRILRPFKPSKFNLNGEIGFDSPDITGKFLAAESVFVCFTGLQINIKGNFSRKCVNLNFSTNGSLCLFSLLWPVALYVFSKPIWKIIWKYIINKEENNEQ